MAIAIAAFQSQLRELWVQSSEGGGGMKTTMYSAVMLGAVHEASIAHAQVGAAAGVVDPIYGYGYGGFGNYATFSSTAAEGFLRGRASVIRAAGEFNYTTSLALINIEEAR